MIRLLRHSSTLTLPDASYTQVSLGDLTVTAQSIGVARSSFGFDFVDGIMAFGPEELTSGTVQGADIVPTFMQGLVSQGQITQNVLGVSFEPLTGSVSPPRGMTVLLNSDIVCDRTRSISTASSLWEELTTQSILEPSRTFHAPKCPHSIPSGESTLHLRPSDLPRSEYHFPPLLIP
jgi:hypothetical protein